MPRQLRLTLAVALGSALGALARYGIARAALDLLGPAFPWGTLAANVLGSFLIGFYATLTEPDGRLFASPTTRQFVMGGFCGGFTTFSVFSLESLSLLLAARYAPAAVYVATSLLLWLGSVWLGHRLAQRLNRLGGSA